MKVKSESEVISHVRLFTTPWTAAHQAPPSTGFSRQEYWSGVPSPSPFPCHRNTVNTATCCHKFFQVNDPKIKKRKGGRQRERERKEEGKKGSKEGGKEEEREKKRERKRHQWRWGKVGEYGRA